MIVATECDQVKRKGALLGKYTLSCDCGRDFVQLWTAPDNVFRCPGCGDERPAVLVAEHWVDRLVYESAPMHNSVFRSRGPAYENHQPEICGLCHRE